MRGSTTVLHGADVLVVARSKVNLVVVSRIVERAGLSVHGATPDDCMDAVAQHAPAIIILDGTGDGDCDRLIEPLRLARSDPTGRAPAVILLSATPRTAFDAAIAEVCDLVVAKPVTVERLQPAVVALHARLGGGGG